MEGNTLTRSRVENIRNLDGSDFAERLKSRQRLVEKMQDVVVEALNNGEIEQWEYPEIESALGVTFAAFYGVLPKQQDAQSLLDALTPQHFGAPTH